jgi:F-type H+-transporting ATPase subunit b
MWWELAEKIFNFAVLVAVIYIAAKKPVASMLQKRRESIKQAIEEGERAKQDGEQLFREHEARLKRLDQEIEQIRQTLIKEGERERDRIIKEAQQMAEKIKRQAELSAQQELKMTKLRLQEEMATMTVQLAEELLKKHLQPKDHERLVDDYIEGVRSLQ